MQQRAMSNIHVWILSNYKQALNEVTVFSVTPLIYLKLLYELLLEWGKHQESVQMRRDVTVTLCAQKKRNTEKKNCRNNTTKETRALYMRQGLKASHTSDAFRRATSGSNFPSWIKFNNSLKINGKLSPLRNKTTKCMIFTPNQFILREKEIYWLYQHPLLCLDEILVNN